MFTAKLIRTVDLVCILAYATLSIGTFFWLAFGRYDRDALTIVLLFASLLTQAWIVLILLRIGFIVLQARADIALMPESAARMALLYQQGAQK